MITSKQNQLVKKIRSLSDKKYRDEYGLYVVEGVKMVNEAFLLGQDVVSVVRSEHANFQMQSDTEITVVTEEVFGCLTNEVSPQGVLAVIKKPSQKLKSPSGSCLFLDGVSDPGNVGAIIRTAVASGYKELYLTDCADAYSPKAVRSSMSGIYGVTVYIGKKDEILGVINKPLVVADMGGENVFTVNAPNEFCLVIGNEAHGVSKEVKEMADLTVSIPMQSGMESLNASVSAGILMYALKNKF